MARKKKEIPTYGTVVLKGVEYYRTRIEDADGRCPIPDLPDRKTICIMERGSVFWALPVSTQWHIHSECLSSNTNKKARSNSTFCREQKRAAFPKNPRKSGSKSLG